MQVSDSQKLLELKTNELLAQLGSGKHIPGSGSAAALLGLISCKMMQTVITATRRNNVPTANLSQLEYIDKMLVDRDEPFFRKAVQTDADQFDIYFIASQDAKRKDLGEAERKRLSEAAR